MKEILYVKNFGPIVDATIEIKAVNIFIGTTSSGKGMIVKLIAIFKSGQLYRPDDNDPNNYITQFNKLLSQYNIEFIISSNTYIRYDIGEFFTKSSMDL